MRKYIEITRTTNKCVSIVCDVCGKEYDNEEDWLETQEFTHIAFTGGFGSVFGDGDQYRCDICQHCLKEKLGDDLVRIGGMYDFEGVSGVGEAMKHFSDGDMEEGHQ